MLDEALAAWLGNAFACPASKLTELAEVVEARAIGPALRRHLDLGDLHLAERHVLALGHVQACKHPDDPRNVLGEDTVPRAVVRGLPRPRGAYLRIAMAAGRCHRALSRLRGTSSAMQRVRRDTWAACFGESLLHALELERVIRDHDVLILGETGTGKESVAFAIQEATPGGPSGRPAPSAAVNAAAIPATLVESELFGHVRGSFTGATEHRSGRIRSADGGTFFLDEVGDLQLTAQVKLVRVIESNVVHPVGSDEGAAVDVRYVAATHQDLLAMVDAGSFRRDLYERVAGNVIRVPALRERPDDIPEIGLPFVQGVAAGPLLEAVVDNARRWLSRVAVQGYAWPGNVRELQNALRNVILGLEPFPQGSPVMPSGVTPPVSVPATIADGTAPMGDVTAWYARRVLVAHGNNYAQAARALGVDRSTLRRWVRSGKVAGR
jgi:DNA-binding NtrC family response regulator